MFEAANEVNYRFKVDSGGVAAHSGSPRFSAFFCTDERCMYMRLSGTQNGLRLFLVACHMTSVIAWFHEPGCQCETKYLI